jgi:hypothetical protein
MLNTYGRCSVFCSVFVKCFAIPYAGEFFSLLLV